MDPMVHHQTNERRNFSHRENREFGGPATGPDTDRSTMVCSGKKSKGDECGIRLVSIGKFPVKSVMAQRSQKTLESI